MSVDKTILSKATIKITFPRQKVWGVLTRPDLIKQYLFGTTVTSDWQIGSPIKYECQWKGKEKGHSYSRFPYCLISIGKCRSDAIRSRDDRPNERDR